MKKIALTNGGYALVDRQDFAWLSQWSWCQSGGYAMRTEYSEGRQRTVRMHRQILGEPADLLVDHINGEKLDNRRSNLRTATRAENNRNAKKRADGQSQYRGVSWHKQRQKWQASIRQNNRQVYLGIYDSEERAAKAYDDRAVVLFGEFAKPNFPKRSA